MSYHMTKEVLLVGAGGMAVAYAKVLAAQGVPFSVVGRSEERCERFAAETGLEIRRGGVERYLEGVKEIPACAVVAVNIEEIAAVTRTLLAAGVKRILLEKPAGLNWREIEGLSSYAAQCGAEVYVAYNRRFYASVLAAQEIIAADGGIDAFHFEFTEWSHQIVTLQKTASELGAWFLANSTHVIDLAFFLGGAPARMECHTRGTLDWYRPAAVFTGSGVSENGALFSYQADWRAPGRWSVECMTTKHRLIFRPMEKLQIQKIGSVAIEPAPIDDALDTQFKPGLYRQVTAFLNGETGRLLTVAEHAAHMRVYDAIERGENYQRG